MACSICDLVRFLLTRKPVSIVGDGSCGGCDCLLLELLQWTLVSSARFNPSSSLVSSAPWLLMGPDAGPATAPSLVGDTPVTSGTMSPGPLSSAGEMFSAADWKHSFSEALSTESWKVTFSSSSSSDQLCVRSWAAGVAHEARSAPATPLLLLHTRQEESFSRCRPGSSGASEWDALVLAWVRSRPGLADDDWAGGVVVLLASGSDAAEAEAAALFAILCLIRCLMALANLRLRECLATVVSASSSVELSPAL